MSPKGRPPLPWSAPPLPSVCSSERLTACFSPEWSTVSACRWWTMRCTRPSATPEESPCRSGWFASSPTSSLWFSCCHVITVDPLRWLSSETSRVRVSEKADKRFWLGEGDRSSRAQVHRRPPQPLEAIVVVGPPDPHQECIHRQQATHRLLGCLKVGLRWRITRSPPLQPARAGSLDQGEHIRAELE